MKKIYLFILFFLTINFTRGQKNGSIKGTTFDTIAKSPVAAATITVLDAKDSSLVAFGMTDNSGGFRLNNIPSGQYRLLITHVNYWNKNIFFNVNDSLKEKDLAHINLDDKTKTLEEVVVKAEAPPVTMIGDTIQYNAGSFKVQPNANVEQLLKKMPGIKVEKDGTIKAQGEKVNKVLVDGKEFFGNDPKIATKNLPADAVDKVQVYDKQSDQAQLTGFDDGNYEKTINLKLKKDKKKGVFGKVTAGGGNKELYENRFNINSFKGARQLSAIGMGNNDNAEGFSFMDILNFTGELPRMQKNAMGGNININISSDNSNSLGLNTNNNGINEIWAGGLNYNNIIGNKTDLQSNYFYNHLNQNIEQHTNRENFIPGSANTYYNQNSSSDNINTNHRLNLNILYQIDSMSSLKITPSLNYQKTENRSSKNYQTLSADNTSINDGISNNISNTEGYNFKNDLFFRKKFKRKGRTFSILLQTSINESNGNGNLNSITNFYGINNLKDTINQQSNSENKLLSYNTRIAYTEPIFKKSLLELSVVKSNSNNQSDLVTYNYNKQTAKYDNLNAMQTNDYKNIYSFTNGGIRIRTQKKKYNYSFGASWQQAKLEGKIAGNIKDSIITKNFQNILLNASFKYNLSKLKSFSIAYNTNTNQPSIAQLQPAPDLTNRLNIRLGNPDLKQEYNHTIQSTLLLVNPYKNKNLFTFLNIQSTQNKIVNYDSLDIVSGIRYSKPVNVNGVFSINTNINYGMPIRPLKGTIEFGSRITYSKNKQFINSFANNILSWQLGPEIGLDINPNNNLNISLNANINYNNTKYSLQSAMNTNYLSQEYNANIDWQLPKHFSLSSDFTYTINSQLSSGFNTSIPMWNASITKQFLKYNRGELKLSVHDLLNRNVDIIRSSNQNYIEDSKTNLLQRFFMLSFTYSLSKAGLNNMNGGGIRMIVK